MAEPKQPIHIFHHSFTRGGGKERYGLLLGSTFKEMGHPVTFHSVFVDDALAKQRGSYYQAKQVPGAALPAVPGARLHPLLSRLPQPQLTGGAPYARDEQQPQYPLALVARDLPRQSLLFLHSL